MTMEGRLKAHNVSIDGWSDRNDQCLNFVAPGNVHKIEDLFVIIIKIRIKRGLISIVKKYSREKFSICNKCFIGRLCNIREKAHKKYS